MKNRDYLFKRGVSGNPHGRPRGSKNKLTLLRSLVEESFERNEITAAELLDEMFSNKHDFKWLCSLKASMEPKSKESPSTDTYAAAWLRCIEKAKDVDENGRLHFRKSFDSAHSK